MRILALLILALLMFPSWSNPAICERRSNQMNLRQTETEIETVRLRLRTLLISSQVYAKTHEESIRRLSVLAIKDAVSEREA